MDLKNKVVVITGASSGIGLKIAEQLADEGCHLALLARRIELLEEIKKRISRDDLNILTLRCDISSREEVTHAFTEIFKVFNRIDIALLNAGVDHRIKTKNFNSKYAEEIFGVNVLGLIYCVEALLPKLKEQQHGMIVGVSSLAEVRGFPKSGFYCASKAAASKFLESIRVELRKYNIKVLTVKPGFVKTPMTDKNEFKMPFLMDVKKAASIIIKGMKKEKRIIQFPFPLVIGASLIKMLPDFIFDYLAYSHVQNLDKKRK
jgi:short-subunit dehydrogenase